MTFARTSSMEAGFAKAPSGTIVLPTTLLSAAAWRASTEWIESARRGVLRLDPARLAQVRGGPGSRRSPRSRGPCRGRPRAWRRSSSSASRSLPPSCLTMGGRARRRAPARCPDHHRRLGQRLVRDDTGVDYRVLEVGLEVLERKGILHDLEVALHRGVALLPSTGCVSSRRLELSSHPHRMRPGSRERARRAGACHRRGGTACGPPGRRRALRAHQGCAAPAASLAC